MLARIWIMAVVVPLLAACGDSRERGGGDGSGGGGDPAWQTYCETTGPERGEMCGAPWTADDTSRCLAVASCTESLFRADLHPLIADCLGSRDCETNEDICYSPEGLGATPSSSATSYNEACLAKRSACIDAGEDVFGDDYCYVGIVKDEVIEDIRPCLDEACADVSSCFTDVVPRC